MSVPAPHSGAHRARLQWLRRPTPMFSSHPQVLPEDGPEVMQHWTDDRTDERSTGGGEAAIRQPLLPTRTGSHRLCSRSHSRRSLPRHAERIGTAGANRFEGSSAPVESCEQDPFGPGEDPGQYQASAGRDAASGADELIFLSAHQPGNRLSGPGVSLSASSKIMTAPRHLTISGHSPLISSPRIRHRTPTVGE